LDEIGDLNFYCHDSPVDFKHFELEMWVASRHLRSRSLVVLDNTEKKIFDEAARSLGTKAFYLGGSSLGGFRALS
jgi:hypothetical protein